MTKWQGSVYKKQDESDFPENWYDMRDAIIARYKSVCYRCDAKMKKAKLQLHHIMPREEGGSDDVTNLIPLCIPCHDFVEVRKFKTKAEIMGSYEDAQIGKGKEVTYQKKEESFCRPDWHRTVYGGDR